MPKLQTVHTNKSTTPQPPNCAHQQEHHSTASKLCTPTRAPLHSLQTVHTNKSTTPQPPNCAHQQEHHSTASKLCTPTRAPLHSLPIGRPWQIVAIDILQVPVSTNNNKYLLVIGLLYQMGRCQANKRTKQLLPYLQNWSNCSVPMAYQKLSTLIRVQTLKVPSLSKLWRPSE